MRIYKKLFPFLKPHLGLLGLASLCMVASSLFKGVSLMMLAPLVNIVLLNRPVHLPVWLPPWLASALNPVFLWSPLAKLHLIVGVSVVLFLLKGITLFGQTYWMNDVALRFLRDIRNGLYRKYQTLSVDFFSGERTGELVSRITYDVSVLQNALTQGFSDLVFQTSQAVIFAGIVFFINWRLALLALLLLPAIGFPVFKIGRILRKLGLIVQERMADLNSRLIETLQGIRITKAFTAEEKETARFSALNQQYYKANVRTIKRREILGTVVEWIGTLGGLLALEIGGRAILAEQLSPGSLVLFLVALLSLMQPIKRLSQIYSINQEALGAAERVLKVLEMQPAVSDAPKAPLLSAFQREIRYEGVFFQYAERPILQGIDLTVKKGEVVALVGSSGAGKTTLVNLLLRFYDPMYGRLLIDGVDVKTVTVKSLRRQVGLVTQDPFLFHDSVRANISYGDPAVHFEKIIQAAAAANADGFIRRFAKGYETQVGDLGGRLSGGERQRIAIARALLKDPPILILDEATSQLDSESEALVQEALERLMQGRTVFVISHRLSTIRNVDRIIVMHEGQIAEVGRHEELMQGSRVYRKLYELQFAQ